MSGDRVERVLRERGPRELGGSIPPLPADVDDARSRLRLIDRRRGIRVLVGGTLGTIAAAAAVVVVAVALTAPQPVVPPGAGTASAPPSAAPDSAAPAIAACRSGDLAATAAPWGAAAGSRGTMVTVTNTSSSSCLLSGYPGARLANASGVLAQRTGDPADSAAIRLAPGGSLTTSIVWSNWCGANPAGTIAVTLVLPTGDLAVAPDAAQPGVLVPPCLGSSDVNTLSTIDFQQP